mmetsp:Transcript_2065/g.3968  ORF Transcript_2065/g.3968 Transcript_2065/m.3968 type:complete len:154 (-) Transcript_2065:415-876(-)
MMPRRITIARSRMQIISCLLLLLSTVLVTSSFAFQLAPLHRLHQLHLSNSKLAPSTMIRSSAFTYEDWHAHTHTSLRPLDDLGVLDNANAAAADSSWDNANAVANAVANCANCANARNALPAVVHSADGESITEIAVAFLPVALLIVLEIVFT